MTERIKSSLRLRSDLIDKARDLAKKKLGDESKWREIVEEAMSEYFVVQLRETDISVLLSRTEEALFDRLFGKIEREFNDMSKRMTNRVGGLIAVSSYDTALTAIMTEELYKKGHSSKYGDARKLAAERMKTRWAREGADEIQLIISEKAESENEARKLQVEVESLEDQVRRYKQLAEKQKQVIEDLRQENEQIKENQDQFGSVIYWARGLIEHLEQASRFTTAKSALEEYNQINKKPPVL